MIVGGEEGYTRRRTILLKDSMNSIINCRVEGMERISDKNFCDSLAVEVMQNRHARG